MPSLIPFQFGQSEVRVIEKDGEPWFVAADVCAILEIGNVSMALSRLDDDEKGIISIDTRSENGVEQRRDVSVVSESGLYDLIFTSRKPEAKPFRKWVTKEVLPAIRRTGRYVSPPAGLTPFGSDWQLNPGSLKNCIEAFYFEGNFRPANRVNGVISFDLLDVERDIGRLRKRVAAYYKEIGAHANLLSELHFLPTEEQIVQELGDLPDKMRAEGEELIKTVARLGKVADMLMNHKIVRWVDQIVCHERYKNTPEGEDRAAIRERLAKPSRTLAAT